MKTLLGAIAVASCLGIGTLPAAAGDRERHGRDFDRARWAEPHARGWGDGPGHRRAYVRPRPAVVYQPHVYYAPPRSRPVFVRPVVIAPPPVCVEPVVVYEPVCEPAPVYVVPPPPRSPRPLISIEFEF